MILPSRSSASAFSLVEVTLALGIIAFCLVALFGLLPVGVNNNQLSITQTAAASAAAGVVSDLRAVPRAAASATPAPSLLFGLEIPAVSKDTDQPAVTHTVYLREDGSAATAAGTSGEDKNADTAQNPFFRATVYFSPLRKNQRNATMARVLITWPAQADSDYTKTPTKYTGTFETVTALDRN